HTFDLTVVLDSDNHAPTLQSQPRTTATLGRQYLYQVAATDSDGDPLEYVLDVAPSGMSVTTGGLISWKPDPNQFGLNPVKLRVTDGRGGVVGQDFTIDVTDQTSNQDPTILSTPVLTASVGQTYSYGARGIDPDGDPLVWSFSVAPAGMSIDSGT